MLDFAPFAALTFDCYGTLIDWETGLLNSLRPVLAAHRVRLSDEAILGNYAEFEETAQRGDYRPYKEILQTVVQQFGSRFGFAPDEAERNILVSQFDAWRPFPDTAAALHTLSQRFSLNIVSNIDDDLFAITAQHLPVPFANIITAQQVGSYKPAPRHFEAAIERIGLPKERILHVAQSLFHDIAPTNALGFTNVWVNRAKARHGFGATRPALAHPDLEVPDLQTLADYAVGKS